MKKYSAVFLLLFLCYNFISAQSGTISPLSIGEIHTIYSNSLNEERTLNIYLPAGYDSSKIYPVIYLLDGSMNEDFIHTSGLTQFFHLMYDMPETIVVGVSNIDRKRDFTFRTDLEDLKKNYPTTGHSDKFISFVKNELQPYVRSKFKTNGTSFLIGQSLGGLLASEILLHDADLFTHYFIISPSLWWDNESMLKKASELYREQPDSKRFVYISAGKNEPKIMQTEAKKLYDILSKSGKANTVAKFLLMTEEDHATILHNSIYQGFKLIFKPLY